MFTLQILLENIEQDNHLTLLTLKRVLMSLKTLDLKTNLRILHPVQMLFEVKVVKFLIHC